MAQPKEVQRRIKDVEAALKMVTQAYARLVAILGEEAEEEVPEFEFNAFEQSERQRRGRVFAHFGKSREDDL